MPYASKAQQRFFHSPGAAKAGITPAEVKEFDEATKGKYKSLPERAKQAEADFEVALRKVAALAASNALQTFTGARPLPTPTPVPSHAPKAPTTPPNPTKGMAGLGGGPKVPSLAEPAGARAGVLDALTQGTAGATDAKLRDGATLPALV